MSRVEPSRQVRRAESRAARKAKQREERAAREAATSIIRQGGARNLEGLIARGDLNSRGGR